MDDSGDTYAAKSEFPAWFPTLTSGEPCGDLARLSAAVAARVPMAFFNLVCQEDNGKIILKTTRQAFTFAAVRSGPKAERLLEKADTLLATEASSISIVSQLPEFQPYQDVDYASRQATLTVARLVHLAHRNDGYINSVPEPADASTAGATEHADALVQINHCRVQEPKTRTTYLPLTAADSGRTYVSSIRQDRWT